jgi:glycosyltransferase involved in cell wall biosynthesis
MRALVVSNLRPDAAAPGRGVFVRDQVAALRELDDVEVTHFEFPPGPRALAAAAATLALRHGRTRYDVVHAHFGLSAWPALAARGRVRVLTVHGTDVRHPRTRRLTAAVAGRMTLVAAVSSSLLGEVAPSGRLRAVLPCGVSLDRLQPMPRDHARAALGLDPAGPYLLFPADPDRAEKRFDRAREVAGDTPLLTLGRVAPADVPLWINAANAVLVPSDAEGFGLAALEALACDVPVLATDVGVHPLALDGVAGTLCAPFECGAWRAAAAPHLAAADPRVAGRARAELFSARRMAERVLVAWRGLLADA